MEEKNLNALDKMIDPPMNAPSSMKNQKKSIIPGEVNYVDAHQGQQSFVPAYQISPQFRDMAFMRDEVKRDINRTFYADLFAMIQNDQRNQRATATEIAERHEEKLTLLGPVIERLEPELLDRVIDRVFNIMELRGELPDYPDDLIGANIEVEYISLLSQAQKLVGVSGMDQFVGSAANLAEIKPEILDKINGDDILSSYADMFGVPASSTRTDEETRAIREQRARDQAVQRRADAAERMVQGAKTMSETPMGDSTALEAALTNPDLLGAVSGQSQ
jgi:hypothetical protein